VVRLAFVGLAAALVKTVGSVGAAFFHARLSGAFGDALRLDVLRDRANALAHPRHDDHGAQEGASLTFAAVDDLTTGVREAQAGFAAALAAVRAVLQLVPLVALAVWSGSRLVLVAVVVMLPFAIALSRAKRRVKRAQKETLDQSASLLEATDEAIRHVELWHSYGASARVADRVARAGRALSARMTSAATLSAALSGATEALGALALLLAVITAGRDDGARLLVFAVAFFMAYKPVRELAEARIAWTRATAAMERITKSQSSESSEPVAADLVDEGGALVFDKLELARGTAGAIDARIEPGTIVVIRGATGIGKTTLLRTLLGFAKAAGGAMRWSGKRPFAWVPQDAPIVRGTLAENVALGHRGGGEADVRAVMEAIGAGALYEKLGDAQLGVGGRAVSGGEQKQIAIARALATNKPIVLLDEPTSGLDDRAQASVLAAIEKLRGKRTVILVTHRPEPCAIADRVISFAESGARSADLRAP